MHKHNTLLFCSLFLIAVTASAQKTNLKGIIEDTSAHVQLVNTTISLLKAKDSTLYKFTRSKEGGMFEMNGLDTGKYVMMINHNRYADYFDTLSLQPNETKDIGKVMMTLEANLLADVTVRTQIAAMRMKGDTLEYAADSFHVREGATVEDLLKNLPGIQVDKNGHITAQGEEVKKVLVDGEEFFSDDPTVATQNLQADAVKSVQVFDKKSDQSEFTGIDDGTKTKTINLKLKDDKKNGYFGKVDAGGGNDDRWNNTAMMNDFHGKKKVSGYGIMSSTGKTGLGWDEQSNYGSGDNGMEMNDDLGGVVFFGDGGGDEFSNGNYYGQGIPKAWAAGLNFANKYNDDKQSLNGNYRFNKISSVTNGSINSQSILPDSLFYNTETSNAFSTRWRHSLNGIYEQQFDSSFSLKLTANGYLGHTSGYSDYNNQSLDADHALVNQSLRNTSSNGDNSNLNANLLLRKKFKKQGRTLALNISNSYNGYNTDGFLYSLNSFYTKGSLIYQDTTDQEKKNDASVNMLNTKLTFTEPIVKNLFAEINYGYRLSTSNSEKLSYNKTADEKYTELDTLFSTRYKFDVTTNTGGLALKYNSKKITVGAGTNIASTNFDQKDNLRDTLFQRDYINFFPRANFAYKFNQTSRISFSYNGSTRQPSITQISPVADNTNPLIITIGNPLLKQEFSHNINFSANSFKVLKQRGFFLWGGLNITDNAIVTNQYTTTNGITTYTYVNADGNYNAYGNVSYFMKFAKADFNLNWGLGYNSSQYSNFVNREKNETKNYTPSFQLGFNKAKEKKYSINYYANINYNISTSSINKELQTKYWSQSHDLDFTVYLLKKYELNNSVNASLAQKTATFNTDNNFVIWNAYVGRKLLKNDKGLLKFSVNDILNQNKGYSRSIQTNVITETNYNTIKRYFMLSFVWNFSKTAAGMPAPGQ